MKWAVLSEKTNSRSTGKSRSSNNDADSTGIAIAPPAYGLDVMGQSGLEVAAENKFSNHGFRPQSVNSNVDLFGSPANAEALFFPLQAKLEVGSVDDKYEREADRIADRVMRMPATDLLQRQTCACGRASESGGRCVDCQRKRPVLQRVTSDVTSQTKIPLSVHQILNQPGRPLDQSTREFMESHFGRDFSQIRIHTDARAGETAQMLNAAAYTLGQHIVFAPNQYMPQIIKGRKLLAHELVHTIQQDNNTNTSGNIQPQEPAPDTVNELSGHEVIRGKNLALDNRALHRENFQKLYSPILQRQINFEPAGTTCNDDYDDMITDALEGAEDWRRAALQWLDNYLNHISARSSGMRETDFRPVGQTIYQELNLLDRHFRIRTIIRRLGGRFPFSEGDSFSSREFEILSRASSSIRRYFRDVHLDLPYLCATECPRGRHRGSEVSGSAVPGSGVFTIYTSCWQNNGRNGRIGVVLHESFHASFSNFDYDSYSQLDGESYPGHSATRNADSYATFASIIATGQSYRVVLLAP